MSQVEFIYDGVSTVIQCNENEKLKEIIQKFKAKVEIDKNKPILYSYNANIGINEELTFNEIVNSADKKRNKMSIVVFETEEQIEQKENDIILSKNIICPECKENIKMEIKDFKINLSDCKNGHKKENILLDEFQDTQKIDRLSIICDICKKYNKSTSYNNIFYRCNSCNNNICPLCKSKHDQSHKIINYDDKYFICNKHNEMYGSYCEDCKINLCTLCYDHKDHKRINFIDILPEKERLIEKMNELKEYIFLFNNDINMLINVLNEVKNKMSLYYKINEIIINNYDNKYRNYETIDYLNQFENNYIIYELKSVIEKNTILDKFKNVCNIYSEMNIDEISLIYNTKGKKEIELIQKEKKKLNYFVIIFQKDIKKFAK